MHKPNIYLLRFKTSDNISETQLKISNLFKSSNLKRRLSKNDLTAVKLHFGEHGNSTFVPPVYIKPIIDVAKSLGVKPFLTDTNVLYKSKRDNAYDHLLLAHEHGFTIENTGAPTIISDGILGINESEIEINAPINKTVKLATEFLTSNSIIVVTHATGHLLTGLGATIKNLGMGMASRMGKLTQHSVSKPKISEDSCTNCQTCSKWCPEDAIIQKENYMQIDQDKCVGCGECLAVCRCDAVKFNWDTTSADLQKQIAEHALGIIKEKGDKMIYFTFLINMTKDCDCLSGQKDFIMDDIGVLLGDDPVAMDQAVLDLTQENSKNLATKSYENHDPTVQIKYGEKIGLGTRNYKLTEVS